MRWKAVHQFVPRFALGDAIGSHVAWIRNYLRSQGCESEIFVGTENKATSAETFGLQEIDGYVDSRADNLLLYHVAQASSCANFLLNRPEPLALVFHNFTPPDLLLHWDPAVAFELLKAQDQLSDLVEKSVFAICDSDFNAQVLSEFGQVEQYVIPLPVEASPRLEMTSGAQPTILFVGRIAPNKGIHDLIAAISVLRQRLPEVRLRVVGGSTTESYDRAIKGLIDALELSEVVSLTGWIDDEQLDREYRQASVFCTLSDHEGFGVPIVEAMARGIPVVAHENTAIGQTVGDAGLLLKSKTPTVVAATLERVLTDNVLASHLSESGFHRSKAFAPSSIAEKLDRALSSGHSS